MTIVSNTSSISSLLQTGLIDILKTLYGEITITPAVQRELFRLEKQASDLDKLYNIGFRLNKNLVAMVLSRFEEK